MTDFLRSRKHPHISDLLKAQNSKVSRVQLKNQCNSMHKSAVKNAQSMRIKAVMLLSKMGSSVTAVTGKNTQEDLLQSLGASEVISREELSELSRTPIGKTIWDFGVDVVSGNILTLILASLKPGGAVACSGMVGGPSFESSIFPFILRGNALLGIDSVEIPLHKKLQVWENFASDWKLDLSSVVREVGLDELEKEIDTILQGGQVGRVLVNLN